MGIQNFLKVRREMENFVAEFQLDKVRKLFRELNFKKIPDQERATFASLARRVDLIPDSLRILQNRIYGTDQPSEMESIEYASGLRKLGLINQALHLLSRVKSSPHVHLHKAFCFINNWDYVNAEKELDTFLQYENIAEDKRMVGLINKAICCLENEKFEEAEERIFKLQNSSKEAYKHIYINSLETLGQIYIKTDRLKKGIETLERARQLTMVQKGLAQLFTQKWLILGRCKSKKINLHSAEVVAFRRQTRDLEHWESLRDFDYHLARTFNDTPLLLRTFFGTPFGNYRTKMFSHTEIQDFPNSYILKPSDGVSKKPIDPFRFEFLDLPAGLNQHRLLLLMLSDFYRPWTVGRIFNFFFSDEIYDPISSPKRVYRMVEQLRIHLIAKKIPMTLDSTQAGYRLRPTRKNQIIIHHQMQFESQELFLLEILKNSDLKTEFSPSEAMKVVPIGKHKWYRVLKKMEQQGLIERLSKMDSSHILKIS